MAKKLLVLGIAFVMLFSLVGCVEKANQFTEDEHIQRITERIENKFISDEYGYTGFSVYPLYSENDELKFFLVEFEPNGFLYIKINEEYSSFGSLFGGVGSMYTLSNTVAESDWSRYTIDETNSQAFPDIDKCWEEDENGERIFYNKSPYSVAEIENVDRYLLHIRNESGSWVYIPAVKTENNYLNLISMDEVAIEDGCLTKKQAVAEISFVAKKHFDL